MRQLKFASILELAVNPPSVVSFIGSGGKSTIISKLASELSSAGQKVLITTTTKFYPFPELTHFTVNNELNIISKLKNHFKNNNLAVLGSRFNAENKIEGVSTDEIFNLKNNLPVTILVEADGSRGLPVKGYNPDEPVIPECTELVLALAGADAIGKPLTQQIAHRPQQLSKAINVEIGSLLTEEKLALIFNNMLELALNQAPHSETFCILNKLDLLQQELSGLLSLTKALSEQPIRPRYFLGTEAKSVESIKSIIRLNSEKPAPAVTAVVLAAGSASRMGKDKLSLPFDQHTILERTLTNVKNAGFDEIIVVVKPGSDWIEKLSNTDYILVENHEHADGQSTSLKAGLMAVNSSIQGVMFVLGDQPEVTPYLYEKLIDQYKTSLKLITAPLYQGQRGNPTIFDRRTWQALLSLEGDKGGRFLFKQIEEYQVDYVETEDSSILADIDTLDDYHKLLQREKY